MGIRLKRAETAQELDDVFWVRRQVFSQEEGKFGGAQVADRYLTDRFDAHPHCANLIAYDGGQAIATIRINLDTGAGIPPGTDFRRIEGADRYRAADWFGRHAGDPQGLAATTGCHQGVVQARGDGRQVLGGHPHPRSREPRECPDVRTRRVHAGR